MKSAADLLLKKTTQDVWHRGEAYADKASITITSHNDLEVQASVLGAKTYDVKLRLTSKGISQSCTCPHFIEAGYICKHIVAVAILWDEQRGILRPSVEKIGKAAVPPPILSRQDIANLFKTPLIANLDHLRILAEATALGGYVRPHSELPTMPDMVLDEAQPIDYKEVKACLNQMTRWTKRKAYDPYFCSGEMVAAFCAMLRVLKKRIPVTSPIETAWMLLELQEFQRVLIGGMIDDSQGVHKISEAHLQEIHDTLAMIPIPDEACADFEKVIGEYEKRREKDQ